jgi:hypothetical protein
VSKFATSAVCGMSNVRSNTPTPKSSKKSSKKKFEKKFEKMFEKMFAKKVQKYYKLSEGGEGGEGGREGGRGGVGWGGWRIVIPMTSLMAAGNKHAESESEVFLKSESADFREVRRLGLGRPKSSANWYSKYQLVVIGLLLDWYSKQQLAFEVTIGTRSTNWQSKYQSAPNNRYLKYQSPF